MALLGVVFLSASFIALRQRQRAGFILLAGVPVAAFCLAYPQAMFWVHDPHGDYPTWLTVPAGFFLAGLFFLPLLALPLVTTRRIKPGIYLFVISATIDGLVFGTYHWTAVLLSPLAAWAALPLSFGALWWGTGKLGWPPLLAARPRAVTRRLATTLVACLLIAMVDLTATFTWIAKRSSLWRGDCSGGRLFVQPLNPMHAVFTVRLIRVGHVTKVSGKWAGDWAIGRVQDRYWGLPSWAPPVVLLTNNIFWEGETFFVNGLRSEVLLPSFLPVVQAGGTCGFGAAPLKDAKVELRLLCERPSAEEVRIIGYVRKRPTMTESKAHVEQTPLGITVPVPGLRETPAEFAIHDRYASALDPPATRSPVAGARIQVTGSSGTTVVTSDQDGMYEVRGMPPDNYTLRVLDLPDQLSEERRIEKSTLVQQKLLELDFYLEQSVNP